MRYKIVRENKPTLSSYGKYKAKAVHNGEVGSTQIIKETARRLGTSEGNKHIRGVRLHFLPESSKGKPELYQDIEYVKVNSIIR